jgi:hypothetical protein
MSNKPTITISVHPRALITLRDEAKKYKTTPQRMIKDLIKRYFEVDCETGEFWRP